MRTRLGTLVALLLAATPLLLSQSAVTAQAATATISIAPTQFVASESVAIKVDFPTSAPYTTYPKLTLESVLDSDATGTWAPVTGFVAKTASSSGVYTFNYRPLEPQKVRVTNEVTDSALKVTTPELQLVPSQTVGTLADPIVSNSTGTSATATATFTPVRSGQATQLQVWTIKTAMTNEVPTSGWKTIKTSTQNSTGKTTFTLSDPLEISHRYRAITTPSGGSIPTISNEVTFAANRASKSTGLPTVYLNANEGASINTRERYFEGQFSIVNPSSGAKYPQCSEVLKSDGSTQKQPLLAAAKGRGNYSWSFAKKSFTVKLDKKTNLCGMGASKKWALVANHYDKSLMRNTVAGFIGTKLDNLEWTPASTPVDLYVNGSYRGSYILIERVAVTDPAGISGSDATRVPVPELDFESTDITGGYVLEWDFRKGADHNITAGSRGYVGIKEPENDYDAAGNDTGEGITQAQISFIDSYVDAADAALFGSDFTDDTSGWRAYIDEASAVDYYLGMELMKPVDGNMWASVFMYKKADSDGGKLFFGPMWDFDLSMGSAKRAGGTVYPTGWYLRNVVSTSAKQSTKTWFNRLNEDPRFRAAVAARWNQLYDSGQLTGASVDAFLAGERSRISSSAAANFTKWSVTQQLSSSQVVKGSWSAEVTYLRSWLKSRISWMNSQY